MGAIPLEETHMIAGHGRALCEAAVTLAERGDASAIVAVTRAGQTAHVLSAFRPRAPVFAVTNSPEVSRRLAIYWGVVPLLSGLEGDVSESAERIGTTLVERGDIEPGSSIVVVSISADLARGASNFLKLQRVGGAREA
jgi:pyruvate kinase